MPPTTTTTVSPSERLSLLPMELQQFEITLFMISVMLRGGVYTPGNRDSQQLYAAVCHVAAVLQTRIVPWVHWRAALDIFVAAKRIWENSNGAERVHLRRCISMAREHLRMARAETNVGVAGHHPSASSGNNQDPENTNMAAGTRATRDNAMDTIDHNTNPVYIDGFLRQHLAEIMDAPPSPPPPTTSPVFTSREAIENLQAVIVVDEVCCAICLEDMTVECDVLQMPCKHLFHASCILPWLGRNNSCPLCRYQLNTKPAPSASAATIAESSGSSSTN